MATKSKIYLTMQQRLNVIQDLGKLSISSIAAKYNVHHTTIRRIKQNSATILEYAEESKRNQKRHQKRRRLRKPMYKKLEQYLLSWFMEKKKLGDVLTDAKLLQKAIELRELIASDSVFKVTRGWLANFKKRNNIRLVKTHKKADPDEESAKTFVEDFNKFIQDEGLRSDCIYNMDESGLMWKALPSKILAGTNEVRVSGRKLPMEFIMVGLCVNATGSHKIMPIIVNKYKKPRALKDTTDTLPVIFKSQSNTYMNQTVFSDWYNNHFKPSVRDFQLKNNINGKVILLLNNFTGYKLAENCEGDNFEIKYFPPNTNTFIQPMDQGIIEKTKRGFRSRLIQSAAKYMKGINEFYETYNLKECLEMIAESWNDITAESIRNAWKKIIVNAEFEKEEKALNEVQELIPIVSEDDITKEEVIVFLKECHDEETRSAVNYENEDEDKDEDGYEERIANMDEDRDEDRNDEGGNEEIPRDRGIVLNQNEREELKYIFQRLQNYNHRLPRSTQLQIDGIKLSILGDTDIQCTLMK